VKTLFVVVLFGLSWRAQADFAIAPLVGTTWELVSIRGETAGWPDSGSKHAGLDQTIRFGARNVLKGYLGCGNDISGGHYSDLTSTTVKIGTFYATDMACAKIDPITGRPKYDKLKTMLYLRYLDALDILNDGQALRYRRFQQQGSERTMLVIVDPDSGTRLTFISAE
jgi:hypothetical protein